MFLGREKSSIARPSLTKRGTLQTCTDFWFDALLRVSERLWASPISDGVKIIKVAPLIIESDNSFENWFSAFTGEISANRTKLNSTSSVEPK